MPGRYQRVCRHCSHAAGAESRTESSARASLGQQARATARTGSNVRVVDRLEAGLAALPRNPDKTPAGFDWEVPRSLRLPPQRVLALRRSVQRQGKERS